MADAKISALPASTTPLAGSETLPVVQSGVTKKVSVANLTAGRAVSMLSTTSAGPNTYNVINNTGAPGSNASPSFAGTQFLGYAGALKAQTDGGDCSNSSFRGVYRIQTCDDGSQNMVTRMQFNGSSDITWSTVNLVQGTAAKGINFTANTPAAGMTSQLLNWYEEGTWTPSVSAGSGTITTVGPVVGRYTRVGREVTIHFSITITTNGTGASYLLMTGIPFAPNATPGSYPGAGFQNSTGKALSIVTINASSQTYIRLYDATYPASNGETLVGTVTYTI